MTTVHAIATPAELSAGVELARAALQRGEVIAFPVEHGYAVACEPFALASIAAIQAARGSQGSALPILIGSANTVEGIAKPLQPEIRRMLVALWPGLLTLVLPAAVPWDLGDGGSGVLAIRQPLDPVALSVLSIGPLAATSAGRVGGFAQTADDVIAELGDAVALVLDAGPRPAGLGSTMVEVQGRTLRILREGAVTRETLERYGIGVSIES